MTKENNSRLVVPRLRRDNLLFRIRVLERAKNNPEFQKGLLARCAEDFEFFADVFLWTFDPRLERPHLPFVLWPKQRDFIAWLEGMYQRSLRGEKINIVIDKPRAVGVTFLLMAWVLHGYLFRDFSARVGSRLENYVDKRGDPDTLFFKLDYMLDHLPEWMVPPSKRAYMVLAKEDGSGNSVVGESANPNFGRGGRKSMIMFDEFGFWAWAKSSWESSGESTNFRIVASTPPESGKDSHFYKLVTNQAGKVYKYEFDWTDVPTRDAKWLEDARGSKSEEEFAREVMKSFDGTTKGKVYAVSMRFARVGKPDYNPELPLFISWDFGLDSVAMIWWQKNMRTGEVYMIDAYSNSNKSIDFYVPFVTGQITSGTTQANAAVQVSSEDYSELELEIIERHATWARTITHYGDPDVRKRNLITKDSTKDYLRRVHKIYVQSIPWGGRTWKDMKEKTQRLFRRLYVHEDRCDNVLSALRSAKYPEKREGNQGTTESVKPIHDWTSHFRTSVEYFADNEPHSMAVKTRVGVTSVDTLKEPKTLKNNDKYWEEQMRIVQQQARTIVGGVTKSNPKRVI